MFRLAATKVAWATAAAVVVAGLSGCLKRTETIEIEPDGAVHLTVVFEGDPPDVGDGDAVLEDRGSWQVTDEILTKEDGKQELTRTARLEIPAGGRFPTDYAGGDAELAKVALQTSTSLRIEERPEGIYYHFKRVYHRRDWARIAYFRHKLLEEGFDDLDEREPAELSDEERSRLAEALVSFEGVKTLVLAEAAANAMEPPLRQDDWLAIHQGIVDVFEHIDKEDVAYLLALEGKEAEATIAETVADVNERIERRVAAALGAADPTGAAKGAFLVHFERERRRFAVTEDLQDEAWEVKVKLPGRLVGPNMGGELDGNVVTWEFDGASLNDRDQVLLATSVVDRTAPQQQ